VVVDNIPGQSGNPAAEAVAHAAADGYTLLLIGPANAINVTLQPKHNFDFQRDIQPVAAITREPLVMLVHPSLPVRTVAEFIAYVKARPADVIMASTGAGSSPHLSGMQFIMMTGVDVRIKHYVGGGPALKGMLSGEAQMMFEPMSASIELVKSGKLRALAVSTATRSDTLPEIPALTEVLPGYEASAVTGFGVPRGTPQDIVARLNREVNAAFADAATRSRLDESGGAVLPGSSTEFEAMLAGEIERWARVIRFSAAK
jgi:tripartite-type tricarboxylate transporter receptor subunit TctC